MSAVTAPAVLPVAASPSGRAVVVPLALAESRRLLLHPVSLLGWAVFVAMVGLNIAVDYGPRSAYENVDTLLSFHPGVMLILVGNLLATRERRAGAEEMLAALPTGADRRTLSLLLAAVPTAGLGLALVVAFHVAQLALERYEVAPGPAVWLQGPMTLLGAVLLGVMVARWFRARVAVVLVMVVMVAANVWLSSLENGMYFGPMMGWARWGLLAESWGGLFDGSPAWRVGYLLGLSLLAGLGAMLPVSRDRRRVVLAGVLVLAGTAGCGALMLP